LNTLNKLTPKKAAIAIFAAATLTVVLLLLKKDSDAYLNNLPKQATDAPIKKQGEWRSLITNVNPPQPLFMESDKTYVGELVDIDDVHTFQDGSTGKAIKLKFKDGKTAWIPRNVATRIYVTKS
jgi:hypothetical protein